MMEHKTDYPFMFATKFLKKKNYCNQTYLNDDIALFIYLLMSQCYCNINKDYFWCTTLPKKVKEHLPTVIMASGFEKRIL